MVKSNILTAFLSLSPQLPSSEDTATTTTPAFHLLSSHDRIAIKSAMADNGILLAPVLEKHVDTDFTVGEVQPSSSSAAPSGAPSAAASVTSQEDDDQQQPEIMSVPKIVAAGKGGALYMPAIFSKVIELSGKPTPNIVYIGTASFDADKNYNRHSTEFETHGCKVERLDVSEPHTVPPLDEMRRLVVDWADVLVCSGGNTLHALLRWKETGLDLLLKEAAQKGTVLCGGSAGAGCWFNSMHSDSLRPDNVKHSDVVKNVLDDDELEDWDYVKISGLGIVPGPDVMAVPHFDRTGTNDVSRSEHAEQVLVETDGDVPGAIGIDNNAAIVIEGDKAMVVSGDGEATCHIVIADEETGETSTAPLVPQDEPVPLAELVDIANPATSEHLGALEEHVETNFTVADGIAGELLQTEAPYVASNKTTASASADEEREPPQVKLVAAGRMGALQLPAIFEKVIELSGKEQPKIAYIGTASFDRTDKYNLCTKAFRELECEIERLDVSEPDTVPPLEEMRHLVVDWADVLLLAGGNTLHALLRWKETGLDLLLKEAAEQGTVLSGGSGGVACLFSSSHSDSLRPDNVKHSEVVKNELDDEELTDWDYVKIGGLGIIPGMAVPHFDRTGSNDVSRADHAEKVLVEEQDGIPAIGIDNNAALVVVGSTAMVVSGDGEATCHIVIADEETGETSTAPLVPQDELVPFVELMNLVKPATAEHLETLEEHVETSFAIAEDLLEPTATAEDTTASNIHDGQEEDGQVPTIKIVAAGRMKALQMPKVFEKVIELSGKEQPKIVYIGTASFDRTDKYNLCTKAFRELECEIERLDVSEPDTVPPLEEMRRLVVDWADVLLCSGGNTLHALLRWKETGLDLLLKEAAEQGTVLCGGSAGAGCWFNSIHSDSLRPDNMKNSECLKNQLDDDELTNWDYVKISGLGIIPAMAVPHYDMTGTNDVSRSEHAEQVLAESEDGVPAIGIDENAALVVEGNKAMVVSGDGEATCHVVVACEETGETTTESIQPHGDMVPLEELMDIQS